MGELDLGKPMPIGWFGARTGKRGRLEKFLGRLLIVLTLVSFIFIGLLLNCVQLVLTLTIKLSNKRDWRRLHKRLHGQIVYAIFAQPVFMLYAWPQWELSILLDDLKLIEEVQGSILGVVVPNHTHELDWMACFLMADQLGNMGNYKCFAKDELRWLPIVGWTFWMADLVYVKRDWLRDRQSIERKLDELLDYDQVLLGIFAEGTRWTEEKQADSVAFANRRGLAPYKHHLFPRPRGFNYTLRHYLRRVANADSERNPPCQLAAQPRVFNLQIVMPDKPKFGTFLEGGKLRASVYCEEVQLSDRLRADAISSRDENNCPELTKLLQDIYRRKDELMDEFEANGGRFKLRPRLKDDGSARALGGNYPVRGPACAFVYWLAGMSVTYGAFVYLATSLFAESLAFRAIVVAFLASGVLLLRRIERETVPTPLRKPAQQVDSAQATLDHLSSADPAPVEAEKGAGGRGVPLQAAC